MSDYVDSLLKPKPKRGRPRKTYDRGPLALHHLIEKILDEKIPITENGCCRDGTVFEAIYYALWIKGLKGKSRAIRVMQKYESFAAEKPWDYYMTPEEKREFSKKAAKLYEEMIGLSDIGRVNDEF